MNAHRLCAVCTLVGTKFEEDRSISLSFWAVVTGLVEEELAQLELILCLKLNFNLNVPLEEYSRVRNIVLP